VDLKLDQDQQLFRETAARFLDSTCPIATVREWADAEPAGFPLGWWSRAAELGWTSLLVSELYGGGSVSGHGVLDLVIVAEEMGRLVSPGPLLPTNLVASAVSEFGSTDQREKVLAGILTGESVATWCMAEPGGVGLAEGVRLRATRQGQSFVLNGTKGPVEAGAESATFLVAARCEGALTQFLVDASAPGVIVTSARSLDLVRRFATVHFDDVVLPLDAVVGEVGRADEQIESLLELAAVLQCASMSGAVDQVLNFTIEYAFDRYSFGRPLASYQALKHRFADMKLRTEASFATAHAAAVAVQERSDNAFELVSVAKAYIGDQAPAIVQDCVQLHGGIGVTWDHDLHLYLRRVVQDRALFGTPFEHRQRIVAALGIEDHDDT
jgi:alkylation response protein AidB-like acyl-CoA dehydrogenase